MSFCQEENNDVAEEEVVVEVPLKAVAGDDKNVVVGRKVLFSGLGSTNPTDQELDYIWDFGDGISGQGAEVTHVYTRSGVYRSKLIVRDYLGNEASDEIIVSVDEEIVLLVTDRSADESEIQNLQIFASTQKILLVSIRNDSNEPDYVISKELAKQLTEAKEDIKQARSIVLWTSGSTGINAMLEVAQTLNTTSDLADFGFNNKNIIDITEKSFSATARIAQNVFNILEPKNMVLTTEANLQNVVTTVNTTELFEVLNDSGEKYQLVGIHTKRKVEKLGPFNFMSVAVNYMVNKGVSLNTIFLILILPLIATIIAFTRQVIGIKAFGIYIPSIIALSFVSIGIKYGLIIFAIIILTGTLARYLARKIKILYLPRMAIVVTIVSLFIFVLFILGTVFEQPGIISVSVFPILIMTFMTEKFVAAQIEKGTKTAILLSLETLILSVLCYFVATWKDLEILILGYPEIILITIVINILIGKWTGLRVLEYIRFRKVLEK